MTQVGGLNVHLPGGTLAAIYFPCFFQEAVWVPWVSCFLLALSDSSPALAPPRNSPEGRSVGQMV